MPGLIRDIFQQIIFVLWKYGFSIIRIFAESGHQYISASKRGLILGLLSANERRRYFVTTSLIGWAKPRIRLENVTPRPLQDKICWNINHCSSKFDLYKTPFRSDLKEC